MGTFSGFASVDVIGNFPTCFIKNYLEPVLWLQRIFFKPASVSAARVRTPDSFIIVENEMFLHE